MPQLVQCPACAQPYEIDDDMVGLSGSSPPPQGNEGGLNVGQIGREINPRVDAQRKSQ